MEHGSSFYTREWIIKCVGVSLIEFIFNHPHPITYQYALTQTVMHTEDIHGYIYIYREREIDEHSARNVHVRVCMCMQTKLQRHAEYAEMKRVDSRAMTVESISRIYQ